MWYLSHLLSAGKVGNERAPSVYPRPGSANGPAYGGAYMSSTEIQELQRTIGQLRHCVGALRGRYGDIPAVRRLMNDIERLDIDSSEFSATPSTPVPRSAAEGDFVVVPDTPYDPALWQGADDEGVGGYHR
jgi:hypothetical protein